MFTTLTHNISAGGFYCVCPIPFAPGDRLDCEIELPNPHTRASIPKLILRCRIEVVHASAKGVDQFGIGCRLEDYEPLVK